MKNFFLKIIYVSLKLQLNLLAVWKSLWSPRRRNFAHSVHAVRVELLNSWSDSFSRDSRIHFFMTQNLRTFQNLRTLQKLTNT
jgi:hypothetical protein